MVTSTSLFVSVLLRRRIHTTINKNSIAMATVPDEAAMTMIFLVDSTIADGDIGGEYGGEYGGSGGLPGGGYGGG